MIGKKIKTQSLLQECLKDLDVYKETGGGITLSGGEPMYQAEALKEFLRMCKQFHLNIGMETCGYARWEDFDKISDYLDFILFDLKHMDSEIHKRLTGVPNDLILMNARRLSEKDLSLAIAIPFVPTCNTDEKNIRNTAEFVSELKSVTRVRLLPYHRMGLSKYNFLERPYPLTGLKALSRDDITVLDAKSIFEDYDLRVNIGF
jgi:pyruvate formate lyase activating enzyme